MSRCLIYKVHTAHQRRAFILPHRFSFVKNFFQVFSTFFVLSFAGLSIWPPSSRTAQLGYHTRKLLSSTFFKFFQTFFAPGSELPLCLWFPMPSGSGLFCPSPEALAYNSKPRPTCQHFFSKFFRLFLILKICRSFAPFVTRYAPILSLSPS